VEKRGKKNTIRSAVAKSRRLLHSQYRETRLHDTQEWREPRGGRCSKVRRGLIKRICEPSSKVNREQGEDLEKDSLITLYRTHLVRSVKNCSRKVGSKSNTTRGKENI